MHNEEIAVSFIVVSITEVSIGMWDRTGARNEVQDERKHLRVRRRRRLLLDNG